MKTQKQVAERLRAYVNGTVDSPYRVRDWTHYDDDFGTMEPGCIDVDRSFHAQCMDLVIDYCLWISDNQFRIRGNAKQAIDNPLPKGWKIIRNERATVPKQGWIGVNTSTYYGHIWLVDKGATQMTMPVIEQNWNSLANLKPKRRLDYYYGCTHFIVPPISSNNAIVRAAKNVLPSPKPMKVLLVAGHGKGAYSNDPGVVNTELDICERDFVRQKIVPNVAKYLKQAEVNVQLYGGSTMNQDMYQDTRYGVNLGDTKRYGMYWAARQGFDQIVEFHLDAASPQASGGHVIIDNNVYQDKIDERLHKVIDKYVGTIRGIDKRDNLLNANISADLNQNYRLVELGFITNKTDVRNIERHLEAFTKEMAEAIVGNVIGNNLGSQDIKPSTKKGTKSKPSKKKPEPQQIEWKWSGTFYPNTSIKVRRNWGLNGEEVPRKFWLNGEKDWVYIHSVIKDTKNKLWWAKMTYPQNKEIKYFYCALGKITDKEAKIKKEKELYGKIKWK